MDKILGFLMIAFLAWLMYEAKNMTTEITDKILLAAYTLALCAMFWAWLRDKE